MELKAKRLYQQKFIEINSARVQIEIKKVKTNNSFNLCYSFYFFPKDIDEFNLDKTIRLFRRHMLNNLPTSIIRSIFTNSFPIIPHYTSNKELKGCFAEIELMCWTKEYITNIKDTKLQSLVEEININFDKFAAENKYINITKSI